MDLTCAKREALGNFTPQGITINRRFRDAVGHMVQQFVEMGRRRANKFASCLLQTVVVNLLLYVLLKRVLSTKLQLLFYVRVLLLITSLRSTWYKLK